MIYTYKFYNLEETLCLQGSPPVERPRHYYSNSALTLTRLHNREAAAAAAPHSEASALKEGSYQVRLAAVYWWWSFGSHLRHVTLLMFADLAYIRHVFSLDTSPAP